MSITLAHPASATVLTLPSDLAWVDEFSWSPVEQQRTYTTTGALLIEEHTRQTGRLITLEGAQDRAWCTRAVVAQLRAWVATANIALVLTLRGVARNVTFNREGKALEGFPVQFFEDGSIDGSDFYVPTLRLLEI